MYSTTASALDSVEGALDSLQTGLAHAAVRDLCHDELTALIVAARRAQARLESVILAAVGEVDARGSHVHEGALTSSAWLRHHVRATGSSAAATVRTARILRAGVLPLTAAALADGAISGRHAQVIAGGVDDTPPEAVALIEAEVVEVAREADVRAVASIMKRFQHALDPDGADEAAMRRYDRRGVSFASTLDGSVAISGLADEVSGALLQTAVDAASPLVAGDSRTAAQRRLDGLVDIARHYLDTVASRQDGSGLHAQVIVTVDAATVAGAGSTGKPTSGVPVAGDPAAGYVCGGSPGATLSRVGPITGSTARRVACDAQLTTVTIGPDGEVTHTRTDRRYFTPAQKRVMIARDGDRCIWPWCDRPVAWADGHHLTWWSDLGTTTVANGGLPCSGHHTSLHEGGWSAERLPDGRYVVRHRDGRVLGPEPYPPGCNRPPPHRRQ